MGRPVFTPLQLTDPTLNRVQAAVSAAFAELERREEEVRSPAVLSTAKDTVVIGERVIDYRGVGGHDVVLPAAAVAGNSKSRAVFIMNNGTGSITVRASGKDSIDDETALGAGDSMLCTSNGRTPAGLWSTLRTQQSQTITSAWFSPVDYVALFGGALFANGSFSNGNKFTSTRALSCLGVRFYWKQPAVADTRTVRVTIWAQSLPLVTKDVVVSATGVYQGTFTTPATLNAYQAYSSTVWDTTVVGANARYTYADATGTGPFGALAIVGPVATGPYTITQSFQRSVAGNAVPNSTSGSLLFPAEPIFDAFPL